MFNNVFDFSQVRSFIFFDLKKNKNSIFNIGENDFFHKIMKNKFFFFEYSFSRFIRTYNFEIYSENGVNN